MLFKIKKKKKKFIEIREERRKVKFDARRNRLKSVEACNTRKLILIKLLKSLESREKSIEYFVFLLVLFAEYVVERYSFPRFDRNVFYR